jgi:hypothetical protein
MQAGVFEQKPEGMRIESQVLGLARGSRGRRCWRKAAMCVARRIMADRQ